MKMNCDLQTFLHVLESDSINEDSLSNVLSLFHEFTLQTSLVADNRVEVATVFCRILSAYQRLYGTNAHEKLHKDDKDKLIKSFNNIERLYLDTNEVERSGSYVRTIWFLSELKTKTKEGQTGEIDKKIIDKFVKDLLDVFEDIRFVFDVKYNNELLFPISQVIAVVVKNQKFNNGIQKEDIYTLQLAVKLFRTPNDVKILDELKTKYNLQFINYLNSCCQIIDTEDLLNYQKNRTIIFYNGDERKVLIRSTKKDYFSKHKENGHCLHVEYDYDKNPIGYFVEFELDCNDYLYDYSEVLETENGRVDFLRLIYDNGVRNVFLQDSIIKSLNGTLMPVNPYCINDSYLVQGNRNKKGKDYQLNQIRELLNKYRLCSVKKQKMNRVTFGLCLFLLDTNNIGVDKMGLSSLKDDEWYQNQVICNWIFESSTSNEHILILLNEWYRQLDYCGKMSELEKAELHAIDFLPLQQDIKPICKKIYPDMLNDERLFSGNIYENEDEPDDFDVEINSNTVAGVEEKEKYKDKKQGNWSITISVKDLRIEDENTIWDQRVGSDVYFFYSLSRKQGCVLNRGLLKALAGVELIQKNCLDYEVGGQVTDINLKRINSFTNLYKTSYEEVAHSTKAFPSTDFEGQTYLRLLHNMIWSGINGKEQLKDYFDIFNAHQIADFSEIERDKFFQRTFSNTLYVPKDNYSECSVLSDIYDKRLKTSIQRDKRHLYESELTQKDGGGYAIFGEEIQQVVFLTDNCISGTSTISALAAYLGIKSDDHFNLDDNRVKKADMKRQMYFCNGQEVLLNDIIKRNNARIHVHSYYGTDEARIRIDEFLEAHEIPYEKSTFKNLLTKKADSNIIEQAKRIWDKRKIELKEGQYLFIREYNMPKMSIFPKQMLMYPRRFINLFNFRKEL